MLKFALIGLISLPAFATRPCYQDTDCGSKRVWTGVACSVVETGRDTQNQVTCRQQCYQVKRVRLVCDQSVGTCANRSGPASDFDPDSTDACAKAIPVSLAEYIYYIR